MNALNSHLIFVYPTYKTEFPEFMIVEIRNIPFLIDQISIFASQIDFFLYVNNKFITYDKHLSFMILNDLHKNIVTQQ